MPINADAPATAQAEREAGTAPAPAGTGAPAPAEAGAPVQADPGAPAALPRAASLTGRGAVLLMLSVFTAGLLAGSLLGWTLLAGLAFVIGCAAAARYTRPVDLLTVAVTPPLLFFAALVAVKTVTATGTLLLSVAEGTVLTLAAVAPWLIAGVALSLIVAWCRGLPRCVRALRAELRPRRPG